MSYPSIVINEFGMVSLRKVSVIINTSMLRFFMSSAKRELAFALVEFIFFSENTLRTPIVGSGLELSSRCVSSLVGGSQAVILFGSQIWGRVSVP